MDWNDSSYSHTFLSGPRTDLRRLLFGLLNAELYRFLLLVLLIIFSCFSIRAAD